MEYISQPQALEALVARLSSADEIFIDTEFMREKTYYARLCLIQIASRDERAIIDPLAIKDISPLAAIMSDPGIVKVFHAAGQDLEILNQQLGVVVAPVFDTQIAATLLGHPQQVGYGALVADTLNVQLDKGDSFTDWSRRPLTPQQLLYAENDVRYLVEVYDRVVAQLDKMGRRDWLTADFDELADPATWTVVPEEMWLKVKRASTLKPRQLAVLREVAAWRELEAQTKDIPRRWVLSDESAIEVARRTPHDEQELRDIRGVGDKLSRAQVTSLLRVVEKGSLVPSDEWPRFQKRRFRSCDVEGAVDLMAALVRIRAKENDVAVPVLASRSELEAVAAGERDGLSVLQGWRRRLVGDELLGLLRGEISFHLEDCVIRVVKRGEAGVEVGPTD